MNPIISNGPVIFNFSIVLQQECEDKIKTVAFNERGRVMWTHCKLWSISEPESDSASGNKNRLLNCCLSIQLQLDYTACDTLSCLFVYFCPPSTEFKKKKKNLSTSVCFQTKGTSCCGAWHGRTSGRHLLQYTSLQQFIWFLFHKSLLCWCCSVVTSRPPIKGNWVLNCVNGN